MKKILFFILNTLIPVLLFGQRINVDTILKHSEWIGQDTCLLMEITPKAGRTIEYQFTTNNDSVAMWLGPTIDGGEFQPYSNYDSITMSRATYLSVVNADTSYAIFVLKDYWPDKLIQKFRKPRAGMTLTGAIIRKTEKR